MQDYENTEDVNRQLERMGYNIGMRLIEDFLARANPGRCYDLRDTADKIQVSKVIYILFSYPLQYLKCWYIQEGLFAVQATAFPDHKVLDLVLRDYFTDITLEIQQKCNVFDFVSFTQNSELNDNNPE